MIILLQHKNPKNNTASLNGESVRLTGDSVMKQLLNLSHRYPDSWIGWAIEQGDILDWNYLQEKAVSKNYTVSKGTAPQFLSSGIGYVEDTPFINFKQNQWYPTWIMSADFGMIHSSVLQQVNATIFNGNFEYDLNLLTRILQPQGLFCYAHLTRTNSSKKETHLLYKFVAQTKKRGWILFLLMCHVIYDTYFPVLAFTKAIFKKASHFKANFKGLQTCGHNAPIKTDYDVIIPTMGRASFLKEVLNDLAAQRMLPEKVVIVEQNEDKNSTTDLDYLEAEKWPFQVIHKFIHQTGACNARNLAIAETTATWVLLFDDDNRFDDGLLTRIFNALQGTSSKVLNMAYLQKGELENQKGYLQWAFFGSGCSIAHREVVENSRFDMALEHGYGEDVDYGMQIRNAGYDIIYAPEIQILHLKAPIGGFRKPKNLPWSDDAAQPKPSPFIMYFRQKNFSENQLRGYRLIQLLKSYKSLGTKNPVKHYRIFKIQWNSSLQYAEQLHKIAI
jgi:glycosyltransferase involved in cell wall biosynthesis